MFEVNTLYLRDEREHQQLQQVRQEAFTPWVKSLPHRFLVNLMARLHPLHFLEAREQRSQRLAGFLFAAPAYWSGDPLSLQTYDYYERSLYQDKWAKLSDLTHRCVATVPPLQTRLERAGAQRRGEAYLLLALLVLPEYRSQHVPSALLDAVRGYQSRLGFAHILSPFRPSQYGLYKQEIRLPHSEELFRRYCELKTDEGLPQDPWLRVLVKNGMQPLKIELRSVQIERPLERFTSLKRSFRPERWYQSSTNVWECGEAATWYVDPFRRVALSVEPNLWGRIV